MKTVKAIFVILFSIIGVLICLGVFKLVLGLPISTHYTEVAPEGALLAAAVLGILLIIKTAADRLKKLRAG